MYRAEPAPATNRHASSTQIDGARPDPTMPTAVISGPPTSRKRRPRRSAQMPAGMFSRSRASPKAVKARPTTAADTPKSRAYSGRTGPTTP